MSANGNGDEESTLGSSESDASGEDDAEESAEGEEAGEGEESSEKTVPDAVRTPAVRLGSEDPEADASS